MCVSLFSCGIPSLTVCGGYRRSLFQWFASKLCWREVSGSESAQTMDGGAAAYVVEHQTTLRGVLKKVGSVQGRQNQYAYEEHTEIAGCASAYGPVEQEKCKVEQSHFPDVYPYVVDGRTGQSLNSPQGIVLQADHAFYYRTPELLQGRQRGKHQQNDGRVHDERYHGDDPQVGEQEMGGEA